MTLILPHGPRNNLNAGFDSDLPRIILLCISFSASWFVVIRTFCRNSCRILEPVLVLITTLTGTVCPQMAFFHFNFLFNNRLANGILRAASIAALISGVNFARFGIEQRGTAVETPFVYSSAAVCAR